MAHKKKREMLMVAIGLGDRCRRKAPRQDSRNYGEDVGDLCLVEAHSTWGSRGPLAHKMEEYLAAMTKP
jgi:hypothetical protein